MADPSLHGYMYAFYSQVQSFTYFAVEYVGRLKAQAASIILNLASISQDAKEVNDAALSRGVNGTLNGGTKGDSEG